MEVGIALVKLIQALKYQSSHGVKMTEIELKRLIWAVLNKEPETLDMKLTELARAMLLYFDPNFYSKNEKARRLSLTIPADSQVEVMKRNAFYGK